MKRLLYAALLLMLAAGPVRADGDDFAQALQLEDAGQMVAADQALTAFVQTRKDCAVGWYHLGRVQQAEGRDADAVVAYRKALVRGVKVAEAIMGAAGPPTAEALSTLRVGDDPATRLQLGWMLEQNGSVAEARDVYRTLFETLAQAQHVDLRSSDPIFMKVPLPETMTAVAPALPANTLYVYTTDMKKLATAWADATHGHPELAGKVEASDPEGGWVVVQAQAFDHQDAGAIGKLGLSLSGALDTDVVFLQVSKPSQAWYWYWSEGHLLDRYCSNPGHYGEVDNNTLRSWAGKPDVLVHACHGTPVSHLSGGKVTITDLNSLVYFYYPEMQTLHPGSWRTPSTIVKTLVQFLGAHDAPSRYGDRTGTFKPLPAKTTLAR